MSNHTIIHIGDTHLQSTSPRHAGRLAALDQVIGYGLNCPTLGAWLWPGDLFHGRSTAQDRNDLAVRLLTMAQAAPVVIIRGNHDAPGDLDIFSLLNAEHPIIVVTEPKVLEVQLATPAVAAIACIPYPHKGGIVAASETTDETSTVSEYALMSVCRGLAVELDDARLDGRITLVAGHATITGAISSSGQPQIGAELSLGADMLAQFGDVYKGFNHIHKAQGVAGAFYAGSIAPMDYGETEPKRFIAVHYEETGRDDNGDTIWSFNPWSHPIETPRLYHVEGLLTRDDWTWQVTAGPGGEPQPAPDSWAGCEVRVRYRFAASERDVLPVGRVRDAFLAADRCDLEPIAVPDTQVRAPEVIAARTLAEKLAAWAELNGGTLAPSVIEKLSALERGDAADIIMRAALPSQERAA